MLKNHCQGDKAYESAFRQSWDTKIQRLMKFFVFAAIGRVTHHRYSVVGNTLGLLNKELMYKKMFLYTIK